MKVSSLGPEDTPAGLGFRMPAEWEPHAATWLSWPHKEASWPGNFAPIPSIWVAMTAALCAGEQVHILVNDEQAAAGVENQLRAAEVDLSRVHLHRIPTDDAWARDHGPIFVTRELRGRRELAAIDWIYNAWGGKYPPWENDDVVPHHVAEYLGVPLFEPGIVLEGGSIDVNGQGTVLTTEACLLNPNRNPHLSKAQIERYLCDYLGARKVLWLGEGIVGDDTDGHIDDLARFVDPRTVVTVIEEDPSDENHRILRENYERLSRMTDQDDEPLRVVTLPMPAPVIYEKQRLPASYANFYIGNSVVLVPVFDDPKDAIALTTLQQLFPTRRIVGIKSRELVWGLGALHCVTQQQPAV
ncbi:MAG TPA: agmatine deiminase family protein [Candidatus Acidoferrales bacterium]|nr:agmatine deiminase family protein [Candidatus Acidoferrales bacterium]